MGKLHTQSTHSNLFNSATITIYWQSAETFDGSKLTLPLLGIRQTDMYADGTKYDD